LEVASKAVSIYRKPSEHVVVAAFSQRLIGLGAQVGSGGARLSEIAGEHWLKEGPEDDLSTTGLGKGHPEDEDKLEGVIEGEPINCVHSALKHGEECIGNPVRQPLSVVNLGGAEQRVQGVIAGNDEAGNVDEKFASNVEEDQEEVESAETEDHIDLGNRRLLFQVVEEFILGQLLVQLGQVVLGAFLDRHCECGWGNCCAWKDDVVAVMALVFSS